MKTAIDKNIIEKIKTLILVVLMISTVLLLYFFWGDISFEDLNLMDDQGSYKAIDPKEVLIPDQIIVSLGEKSYKVADSDKWILMVEGLNDFTDSETLIIEEISKEQYQTVMGLASIRARYDYPISLSDLCLAYGVKTITAFDNVGTVTEIGYGSVSKESLLIFNAKKNKYYRIIRTKDALQLDKLLNSLIIEESPAYFTIGNYLGGKVSNDTLIPVTLKTNLRDFEYNRENYTNQNDIVSEIAQSFFGTTFDFIRKIEEGNGTVIYMYGYGQKVLMVDKNGVIEYKEESSGVNSQAGYLDSLKMALNFIGARGGFESTNGTAFQPYLKNVENNFDNKKGYRFIFGVLINHHKVYYQDKDPVIVEITDGQVTYFRKDLAEYDNSKPGAQNIDFVEAYPAINMLAQNYQYFTKTMGMSGTFEEIANRIISIEPGYVIIRNEDEVNGKAKAVWTVCFENMEAYFDIDTAEPAGYRKTKN